jgi:RNA polymerase sigma factor (sigma-70 family)
MIHQKLLLKDTRLEITNDLVKNLKNYDEGSFSLLFQEYGERIFNLAYRMTGNQEDASDITQETFLQVYRHINSFRGESQLYTWIYAIAKNECFRVIKTLNKSTFMSFEGLIQDAVKESTPDGISESEKRHLANQVKEGCLTGLIRCLSFNQRIAFILHILLHLPIVDVASIMGKSDTSVKVLIHRARKNLKKFLCKNCSLYNSANLCECENLIGFSLRRGWISSNPDVTDGLLDTRKIEEEIHDFDAILNFYSNLKPSTPPQVIQQHIKSLIASKEWVIFAKNEV